jgi:hypothetical protein
MDHAIPSLVKSESLPPENLSFKGESLGVREETLRGLEGADEGEVSGFTSRKQSENMSTESKIRRRSKKDNLDRNFLCGCGKQYLSYPALYTHIKTKHSGAEPEGTIKPNILNKSKGRPTAAVNSLLLEITRARNTPCQLGAKSHG